MYVSTNWLKVNLAFDQIKLNFIKEKLTLCGFEVEETKISKILNKNDIILDLATTTNRPDILSMAGLCEEIKNLLNIQIKQSKIKKKSFNFFNAFFIEKKNIKNKFSSTISFILWKIENLDIKETQPWIKKRLFSANIIPTNNLNDLANYSMLEWGQPICLYDLDKLKQLTKKNNPEISVRFARSNEIFVDSNLKQYFLTQETLVVVAENIPISIAGSNISQNCFVDDLTKNILVQAGIFDPKIFRKSERSIGLRTHASIFYERGVNKFLAKASLNRFFTLFSLVENNFLEKIVFCSCFFAEQKSLTNTISISLENIEKTLGRIEKKNIESSNLEIFNCLNKLNFKFYYKNNIIFVVIPLTRIIDIEEEIDLIEEISRFYGFNKFKSILPKYKKIGRLSKYESLKRKFRECFISLGFSEVYNYSLISDNLKNTTLLNPLTNDYSSLRNNLIAQLIKILEKNINQGNKIFPVFEIGHSFFKDNFNKSFLENELVCAIFGGNNYRVSWSTQEIQLNWFQARYLLETIFNNLELQVNFSKKISVTDFYHPKNCLTIFYKNQEIGIFGTINPKLCLAKGLPKNCFLVELELTKILKLKTNRKPLYYQAYSIYPSLSSDLSLLIPQKINFSQIINIINKCGKNIIETIELFDVYEKFDKKDEYYSLGLKIIFKSKQKTLLKIEVDEILFNIENDLKNDLNITIRI